MHARLGLLHCPAVDILHLIARLNDGGPARVLLQLGPALQARGHRLRILHGATPAHEPDLSPALRAAGLACEEVPGLGPALAPATDARVFGHLLRRLRRQRPQILHTHTAKAGLLGRLAARACGLPCLHSYHGHVLRGYFPPGQSAAYAALERWAGKRAHHHALDIPTQDELFRQFGIGRRPRWHVLPNPQAPLPLQRADWASILTPGRPVIGHLGRLCAIKDLGRWLRCLHLVNRQHPVQGLICGSGELATAVSRCARAMPCPVHCVGQVPASAAYAVIDALLLTSRNEGQPVAVLEAFAAGVPVVANAVGGLRAWQGQAHISLTTRQPAALAQALVQLLESPTARQRQITTARAVVAGLDPAQLAGRYEALYHDLLHAGRA